MTSDTAQTRSRLRDELRHRIRPMTGRDPRERGRTTTPLELLYDLTYVIAFAAAAEQLAHYIGDGHALRRSAHTPSRSSPSAGRG